MIYFLLGIIAFIVLMLVVVVAILVSDFTKLVSEFEIQDDAVNQLYEAIFSDGDDEEE